MKDSKSSRTWSDQWHTMLATPTDRNSIVSFLRKAMSKHLLDENSLCMIEGVMHLSELRVSDVMIPRTQMIVVEKDASFEDIFPIIVDSAHSRFPVMNENRQEVLGILLAKDLLKWACEKTEGESFSLRPWLRTPVFVPENKRLDLLLNDFRGNRNHLAVVVDEYGEVTGLVTIEDVLEQIVGDISDEHDDNDDEASILTHTDGHWSVKAVTPIEEFNAYFGSNFSSARADTIGGLILKSFGRLPHRREVITIDGFQFTVVRSDNRRIHLLHVEKNEDSPDLKGSQS